VGPLFSLLSNARLLARNRNEPVQVGHLKEAMMFSRTSQPEGGIKVA
jgi:hypothetical protein